MKRITTILFVVLFLIQNRLPAANDSFIAFSELNYYTTETTGTIIVKIPADKLETKLTIELYLNKKHISTQTTAHKTIALVPFNLEQVAEGQSVITCKIQKDSQTITSVPVKILKLIPKDNEVKINLLTGGLIADGLPFFPFGFYCGSPLGTLPEEEVVRGFNMIAPYQKNTPETISERKAYMDRCAQLGLKVHYALNGLIGEPHNKSRKNPLTQDERFELFKKEIIAFRDHPALLAWYINDEPLGQSRPVELLEKAYNLVKELDPYHPASIVFMMPHRANEFGSALDIAMTDPYPIPDGVDMVERHVLDLKHHFNNKKSIWLVPQAFGGGEFWTRGPTRQEIRAMTYIGIVQGVKGMQYFIRRGPHLSPKATDAWSECSNMALETAEMTPFLLSGEPAPEIKTDQVRVLAHAWRYRGKILVVAVNKDNKPCQLSLSLPGLTLNGTAKALFENRNTVIQNGQIHDYITAYGTLAFIIDEKEIQEKVTINPSNLILNPSFENNASSGTPGECTARYSTSHIDPGATYFIDNRQAVHGTHSLRMVTPVDSGGIQLSFYHVDLLPGQSYTLSVWGKAKKRTIMPAFEIAMNKVPTGDIFTLDTKWKKYAINFEVSRSPGRPSTKLVLHTAGTAWFDLLEVAPDPEISYEITDNGRALVTIKTVTEDAKLRYTINGDVPDKNDPIFTKSIILKKATTLQAGIFKEDQLIVQAVKHIPVHRALNKPVSYSILYNPKYPGDGDKTLTDGKLAGAYFKDPKWQGFEGTDIDVTIDLGKGTNIHSISAEFLSSVNDGVHFPKEIVVEYSHNGKTFIPAGRLTNDEHGKAGEAYKKTFTIQVDNKNGRYIRFTAKTIGLIPDDYLFKGTKSWLFIDEVLVE